MAALMVDRLSWRMVKFSGLRGPVYVDLAEVAAVMETKEPHTDKGEAPELPIARGATIYLKSGAGFYVRESADTVFEEVHRYRLELEPVKPPMKLSASAPAEEVNGPMPWPPPPPAPAALDG
jgi:hypothetical protein